MPFNPIDLLYNMVAIPSLSGEEHVLADFLVREMAALGLTARLDEAGNAVGVREYADEHGRITREIILLGHMDTVAGVVPLRLAEGRLYGRGTVDAKGPLAAFITAAAQAQLPRGTRVIVIGAVEEESASSKGARFAAEQYQPDWCIIGEPSGWDGVTLGYKGRLLLDYTLALPMGHTAGPVAGAAETAVAFWQAIQNHAAEYNHGRARLFDQLLPSLRHIATTNDGLTDWAMAKIGWRLPPRFDPAALEAWLRPWAGAAEIHTYGYEPAFQADRKSSLAGAFNRALRGVGATPHFKLKTGTADMNIVGPHWNCPIVAYGPGNSQLDHTPDEHIILAEYAQAIHILQQVLETG